MNNPLVNSVQGDVSPLMRAAVMRRDHGRCRYCGNPAQEIDHIEPRAHGGLTVMANLAAACLYCNRSKGARTPAEWDVAKRREALAPALQGRIKVRKRPMVKARRIPGFEPRRSLAEILSAGQTQRSSS
jgi:5-methylcytosine-specific restriction endonuclease McrA